MESVRDRDRQRKEVYSLKMHNDALFFNEMGCSLSFFPMPFSFPSHSLAVVFSLALSLNLFKVIQLLVDDDDVVYLNFCFLA